jgi:hypothetical protein
MPIYPQQRFFAGGDYVTGSTLNAQATAYSDLILAPPISKFVRTANAPVITTYNNNFPVSMPWEVPVLLRGDVTWNSTVKTASVTAAAFISATSASFTVASGVPLLPMSIGDRISTSGFSLASYNVTNAIVSGISGTVITVTLPTAAFTNPFSGTFGTISAENSQYARINTSGTYRVSGQIGWNTGAGSRTVELVQVTSVFGSTNTVLSRNQSAYDSTYQNIMQIAPVVVALGSGNQLKVHVTNATTGPATVTTPNLFAQPNVLQIEWIRP